MKLGKHVEFCLYLIAEHKTRDCEHKYWIFTTHGVIDVLICGNYAQPGAKENVFRCHSICWL